MFYLTKFGNIKKKELKGGRKKIKDTIIFSIIFFLEKGRSENNLYSDRS